MPPLLASRRGRACAAAAAVLALTAGARTVMAPHPTAPHRPPTAAELTAQGLRPPIYATLYAYSPTAARVKRAEQQLAVDCMAGKGFTLRPAPVAGPQDPVSRPTPFGTETLAAPAEPQPLPAEHPESEAFGRALYGDPARTLTVKGSRIRVRIPRAGCQAEAEERLLGDGRERWLAVRISLGEGETKALARLGSDPDYRDALEHWRTCMHGAGIDARDPVDMARALPHDRELREHPAIAADVRCKLRTGFLATAYRRLAVVQQEWLDTHPDVLASRRALLARQAAAADRVLGPAG
ncbi:hypothetical protein [Streptomyces sp. NRRL S-87]|uniref:hypothetical protein n=1 Tax=Streptomyces sp. NRRL S-87 TaxID=1463920 RepID=UPI0004C0807D|nr:hypothetical protein [Streptomyces sp. NRRL S-87]